MTEQSSQPASPITGYPELSPAHIDIINRVKEIERQLAVVYSGVQGFLANAQATLTAEAAAKNNEMRTEREDALKRHADNNYNQRRIQESNRQMSLARTKFEEGFMHLTRAIAQPHSPWIDERNRKAPEPPAPFPPRPDSDNDKTVG